MTTAGRLTKVKSKSTRLQPPPKPRLNRRNRGQSKQEPCPLRARSRNCADSAVLAQTRLPQSAARVAATLAPIQSDSRTKRVIRSPLLPQHDQSPPNAAHHLQAVRFSLPARRLSGACACSLVPHRLRRLDDPLNAVAGRLRSCSPSRCGGVQDHGSEGGSRSGCRDETALHGVAEVREELLEKRTALAQHASRCCAKDCVDVTVVSLVNQEMNGAPVARHAQLAQPLRSELFQPPRLHLLWDTVLQIGGFKPIAGHVEARALVPNEQLSRLQVLFRTHL